MTREEAIKQLRQDCQSTDTERDHSNADDIICALLITLGYADVVEEWGKVDKWYA